MMIRNDSDWREAQERLADFSGQADRIRKELTDRGLPEDAIAIAVAPQQAMAADIAWEVALYERLKAGDIDAVPDFAPDERGKALIYLRIARGWNQRQLAEALGVSEGVVSRDERNEYHGISLEKYGKVLTALGFEDHLRFVTAASSPQPITVPFPAMQRMAASFMPQKSLNIRSEQGS